MAPKEWEGKYLIVALRRACATSRLALLIKIPDDTQNVPLEKHQVTSKTQGLPKKLDTFVGRNRLIRRGQNLCLVHPQRVESVEKLRSEHDFTCRNHALLC
jgi:hypothetical protein